MQSDKVVLGAQGTPPSRQVIHRDLHKICGKIIDRSAFALLAMRMTPEGIRCSRHPSALNYQLVCPSPDPPASFTSDREMARVFTLTGSMPRRRSNQLPPVPTWTCPHCQHVHTPATMRRLDGNTLQCQSCKKPFSAISGKSSVAPSRGAEPRQSQSIKSETSSWPESGSMRSSTTTLPFSNSAP